MSRLLPSQTISAFTYLKYSVSPLCFLFLFLTIISASSHTIRFLSRPSITVMMAAPLLSFLSISLIKLSRFAGIPISSIDSSVTNFQPCRKICRDTLDNISLPLAHAALYT